MREITGRQQILAGVDERPIDIDVTRSRPPPEKYRNWIESDLDGATMFLGNEENDSTDGDDFFPIALGFGMRES